MAVVELNVMDFGAVGDNQTDDTAAIEAAIAAAPSRVTNVDCFSPITRPRIAATIRFPTPTAAYRITRQIEIPRSKCLALTGTASHGVVIRLDSATGLDYYAFRVVPEDILGVVVEHPTSFERLFLLNGGITIGHDVRRYTAVRDCVFRCTPEWCITTEGEGVVNVDIDSCHFTECAT